MPRLPSAMNSSPLGLIHTPAGALSAAAVAGPPSPQVALGLSQLWPLPATVVMRPVGSMRRTRRRSGSAMYSDPSRPTASALGVPSRAWPAGPPSPQACAGPEQWVPGLPATTSVASRLRPRAARCRR